MDLPIFAKLRWAKDFPCPLSLTEALAATAAMVTGVKPRIYGLAFTMGKWLLADNSGNGWSDLEDFFGRPHEISIYDKMVNN